MIDLFRPVSSQHQSALSPKLPYLLPALLSWLEDNHCTPMLVARVDVSGVAVPEGYAQDGLITLNVSSRAVQGLHVDSGCVSFGARFGGRRFDVRLPLTSLQYLFARERPEDSGISLISEAKACEAAPHAPQIKKKRGPPTLRVVE